ncbi:MAG: recombinase family protein [Marmoricola sp.]
MVSGVARCPSQTAHPRPGRANVLEVRHERTACRVRPVLQQDLTAQRDSLIVLGVEGDQIYVDHGLTGTNRERPGLRQALAACRAGDTRVVTKLDRLARSLPDAGAIADELTARQTASPSAGRSTTHRRRRTAAVQRLGDGR